MCIRDSGIATEVQYTEHTTITTMLPLLTTTIIIIVVAEEVAVVVIVIKVHLHIACPTGDEELKERVVIPEIRTNLCETEFQQLRCDKPPGGSSSADGIKIQFSRTLCTAGSVPGSNR